MNHKSRFISVLLSFLMLFYLILPITQAFAVEETIHGIPLQEFDNLTNAEKRYETAREKYSDYSHLPGYQSKLKLDAYAYMYNILLISEKLNGNQSDVLEKHTQKYNGSIQEPLTEEDMIKVETGDDGKTFDIKTKSSTAKKKLTGMIKADFKPVLTEISKGLDGGDTNIFESILGSQKESDVALKYVQNNITDIRFAFTGIKEYLTNYEEITPKEDFSALKHGFVNTFNAVIENSTQADIEDLSELDLFGGTVPVFDPDAENSEEAIGTWEEKESVLGSILGSQDKKKLVTLSQHMLKNIAVSATFKPFTTGLNSTQAFDFAGDSAKAFHSSYGTLRKMIISPADHDMNLEVGMNLETDKDLKYMTLRSFVEKPESVKVLYVDKEDYSLAEIEKEQNASDPDKDKESEVEGEEDSRLSDQTERDAEGGFRKAAQKFMHNDLLINWIGGKFKNPSSQDIPISNVIFASGNLSEGGKMVGEMKAKQYDINESFLLLNNLVEEYFTPAVRLKLGKDMDKPLYADIYGNILTASGIVVIPAVANPFMQADDAPSFKFNRAFIESYPQYLPTDDGKIKAVKGDKDKYAFSMAPLAGDALADEKDLKGEDDEYSEGVGYYVTKVDKNITEKQYTLSNKMMNFAYRFDENFEPMKTLDIWSYVDKEGLQQTDMVDIKSSLPDMAGKTDVALIRPYTVGFEGEAGDEIVSFLKVPDNDDVMRYLYITNLEYIAKISGNDMSEGDGLDGTVTHTTVAEIYQRGVYDIQTINTLVPDFIGAVYDKYVEFLLELANDRYDSILGNDVKNNILYTKGIEEVKQMENLLPLVYKFITVIAFASIIFFVIISVVVNEGKLKQAMKALTVVYIITFMINTSGWIIDTFINSPTRAIFRHETAFWTLAEQENNTHLKQMKTKTETEDLKPENGSTIKLYKIPFDYPYKLLSSPNSGQISIDEFYEHFLKNDNRYRAQNNEMFMQGKYLTTTTQTIFDSSSVVIGDEMDKRMKMKHEIYYDPELAYYLPYYLFIDNIVYNLNLISDISYVIPHEVGYANGTIKTTGRMESWINSKMFLDYDAFLEDAKNYKANKEEETGSKDDSTTDELNKGKIENSIAGYGNPDDFLGIAKILNKTGGTTIEPFNVEGLKATKNAGWYPKFESKVSESELKDINRRIVKVNDNVKKFMMQLSGPSGKVADEHIIKTVALYASLEFNREFDKYTGMDNSTAIELGDVPVERILMSLSIPREAVLDNTVVSYQNYVVENTGYWGLLLTTVNDMLIVFINYIKPILMVLLWVLAGLVIFVKKIILTDSENRSILGSLKLLFFYVIASDLYSLALAGIIKLINSDNSLVVGQGLLLVSSLAYSGALAFMLFALLKDTKNLGGTMVFKGFENMAKGVGASLAGLVKSNPVTNKLFGDKFQNDDTPTKHLEQYFEQKSIKYSDEINDHSINTPINFNMKDAGKKVGGFRPFDGADDRRDDYDDDEDFNYDKRNETVAPSINYESAYQKEQTRMGAEQSLFDEYVKSKTEKQSQEEAPVIYRNTGTDDNYTDEPSTRNGNRDRD